MQTRAQNYRPRETNATFIIILFILLLAYSCAAQPVQRIGYVGSELSYGMHRFSQQSGKLIPTTFTSGTSIGVFAGNKLVSGRIRIGRYSLNDAFEGDLKTSEYDLFLNVHILEFFRTRKNVLDIYMVTGFSHNRFKGELKEELDLPTQIIPEQSSANYQVIGLGGVYIPNLWKRSTSVFCEALLYNAISTTPMHDSNVFINIGVRRMLKAPHRNKRG